MEHSVDDLIATAHPESHLMPGANGIIDQKARLGTVQSSIQAENVRELNSKMENLQVQTPMGRFSRGKSTPNQVKAVITVIFSRVPGNGRPT